jgi:hypothetical protein
MTVEELLKQQQLGQGGASQYLSMPQQQYGGAGQYLGGLLSPELNFNAPTGMVSPQYNTPTYTPGPFNGNSNYMTTDGSGLYAGRFFKDLYRQDPNPLFRLFSLLPNDTVWNKTG